MTLLPVTQEDREAAALNEGFTPNCAAFARYLAGKYDNTCGVQAFARHRISTEATARLAGVRIGLEAAAKDAETWFPEGSRGKYAAYGVVGSIRALDPETLLKDTDHG